jgi:hypothetical protein
MPSTKSSVTILAPVSCAAGTTKASPQAGSSVDVRAYYSGTLTWKMTNVGTVTAPCVMVFQASHDGTNWYDHQTVVASDLISASVSSGTVPLGRGVMYLRAIAYGNATNPVTVEAYLQAETGL